MFSPFIFSLKIYIKRYDRQNKTLNNKLLELCALIYISLLYLAPPPLKKIKLHISHWTADSKKEKEKQKQKQTNKQKNTHATLVFQSFTTFETWNYYYYYYLALSSEDGMTEIVLK